MEKRYFFFLPVFRRPYIRTDFSRGGGGRGRGRGVAMGGVRVPIDNLIYSGKSWCLTQPHWLAISGWSTILTSYTEWIMCKHVVCLICFFFVQDDRSKVDPILGLMFGLMHLLRLRVRVLSLRSVHRFCQKFMWTSQNYIPVSSGLRTSTFMQKIKKGVAAN